MVNYVIKFIGFLLLTSVITNSASADLLISPTRLDFNNRDRSGKVSLVNTSNEVKTYRIRWKEQAQLPNGQYVELSDQQRVTGLSKLSRFVRVSPSQVTLGPGERQHIRLSIRRPQNMPELEYRSHLLFAPVPKSVDLSDTGNQNGASFNINLNLGFSIPVILRQMSSVNPDVEFKSISIGKVITKDSLGYQIGTQLIQKGNTSSFGTIKAYWTEDGSNNKVEIAKVASLSVYAETPYRNLLISSKDFAPRKDGVLTVEYSGEGRFDGQLFDSLSQRITISDIQTITR